MSMSLRRFGEVEDIDEIKGSRRDVGEEEIVFLDLLLVVLCRSRHDCGKRLECGICSWSLRPPDEAGQIR